MSRILRAKYMQVPYFAPTWGRREEAAVVRVLRSGWLTMGSEVSRFETEIASRVGARHAVAASSCTAALHMALVAAGLRPEEPVAVPVYTFTATAGAVLQAGGRPIFVDIDPGTLNMDIDALPSKVPGSMAAWIPVDIAGLPADYTRLRKLARVRGGVIVADAAHSLGAARGKTPVGRLADMTCFSFYANKNLTTAEGGMVVTNKADWTDRLRALRLHGMSKDAWKRYGGRGQWYYEIDRHGFKYNLNDVLAALGRAQLKRFDTMQKARARAAKRYDRLLGEMDEVILPPRLPGTTHAWHLYIIRLRGRAASRRNDIIEFLRTRGIGTSVHFIPLCLQPYWRQTFKLKAKDFPHAVTAYKAAISLPMHPGLSRRECEYVAESLKDALTQT